MDEKKRVSVEIFGDTYALKGDIEPERIIRLAELVDNKMKSIAKANLRLSPVRIAVLAALNFADDYLKLEKDYNQLIEMLKEE